MFVLLEKILRFSIKQRYMVIALTLFVAAFGAMSLARLPIDAVPDVTNKQVVINAVGAALSPVEIEKQVTFPLETSLAGIPGLESTRSLSRNGFAQITAVFRDDIDIYFARQQVNERMNESSKQIPTGVELKMGPISTGLGEVYMWTVDFAHPGGAGAKSVGGPTGWQADGSYVTPDGVILKTDIERATYLRTVQDWIIKPQLKGLPGVAGIDTIGGYVKQYVVEPDSSKLIGYGVSFQEIIDALERNNSSVGAGFVEHNGEAKLVRADGRILKLEEIGAIVIGARHGTPIRIRDVAKVRYGQEPRTGSASTNGREAVVGTALMLMGENSRTVAQVVDEKIKSLGESLPSDIEAKPVLNRMKLVDATIKTVSKNLAEGAILVIVVLFLLLGNIRAALITATAIPLSMLMTSIGMVQGKISGNLMSLGAIDFGLIVDGAVIIVENCLRRLSEKQHELGRILTFDERLEEVALATKEVRQASVFGEAIIITVYIPLLALTGIEGKMFQPMALTVIFALCAAFLLSLTYIPAIIALAIGRNVQEKESKLFTSAQRFYAPILDRALQEPKRFVRWAVLMFAASMGLFFVLGSEFIPTLDEKDIAMHSMRIPSTGIEQSTSLQLRVEEIVSKFKEVKLVFSKTGTAEVGSDPMPPNLSDTFIILKDHSDWPDSDKSKEELISEMEKAVLEVPGIALEFTQPIQMRFNELIAGVRSDVAVKIFGDDFDTLRLTANRIASSLSGISGAADVKVEQTDGLPVLGIDMRREEIGRLNLDVASVQNVVAASIGGRSAGSVFEGDRRFDLVVRLPENVRRDELAIRNLPVPLANLTPTSPSGHNHNRIESDRPAFVPLGQLSSIETSEGPNQISRENGKRRIVVQANVRGRDIGSFVDEAQGAIKANVKIPPGQWITWGGQFENMIAAKKRLMIVVPLCFVAILMLLFSAFNSLNYALLVFSGVPLGLSGGVISLAWRHMPFSISAAVGFIALSGVAVLNGLVMITFINDLREKGMELKSAVRQGCLLRLRPVLMTAMVASLGFLPMALATGAGAEVQRPLATVVVGGLLTSTVLTLVVLPALYFLVESGEFSAMTSVWLRGLKDRWGCFVTWITEPRKDKGISETQDSLS
jgi:cobalt-zinc-cadmium resistance protein CzcA